MSCTGDREIRSVSGRLPDNPGELARMSSLSSAKEKLSEETLNMRITRSFWLHQPHFSLLWFKSSLHLTTHPKYLDSKTYYINHC